MGETDGSEYATPIPLRDNGVRLGLSPWTRLEAADLLRHRLGRLAELISQHEEAPDRNALSAVLQTLTRDLEAACWGAGDTVRLGAEAASTSIWATVVHGLLWPSFVDGYSVVDVAGPETAAGPATP